MWEASTRSSASSAEIDAPWASPKGRHDGQGTQAPMDVDQNSVYKVQIRCRSCNRRHLANAQMTTCEKYAYACHHL